MMEEIGIDIAELKAYISNEEKDMEEIRIGIAELKANISNWRKEMEEIKIATRKLIADYSDLSDLMANSPKSPSEIKSDLTAGISNYQTSTAEIWSKQAKLDEDFKRSQVTVQKSFDEVDYEIKQARLRLNATGSL